MDDVLRRLRATPWWTGAVENLQTIADAHGADAQASAEGYASKFDGRRGAMVVDVVASRQRTYKTRVAGIVAEWEAVNEEHSIRWLAEHRLNAAQFGLSDGEVVTIHKVAGNLRDYAERQSLCGLNSEDTACRMWADCGELEHAPRLDPVVGSVKGIGIALFAYMRMRSGADAIKPDVRVKNELRKLGFAVPNDEHAVLVVARAAATEIGVSRLVLDQLLWWSGG